jgi:alkylated DNA repair dioxygenase AlkB
MPRPVNKRFSFEELLQKTQYFDGKKDVNTFGAGDSFYIANFLKKERNVLFTKIMTEVEFAQMFNIGQETAEAIPRLVSAQSDHVDLAEGQQSAIYRMPGCNEKNIVTTPWTPSVKYVCDQASEIINQKLNHCVLTLFRDQDDKLCFHQDKLVDLQDKSLILSVSFGDARPIVFESIDGKKRQTLMLQPGSLLAIGPKTNQLWYHGIPSLVESVGPRVSLSIRTSESFIKVNETKADFQILGKGEKYQCTNYPFTISHDNPDAYSEETKSQIKQVLSTS